MVEIDAIVALGFTSRRDAVARLHRARRLRDGARLRGQLAGPVCAILFLGGVFTGAFLKYSKPIIDWATRPYEGGGAVLDSF